MATKRFLQFPSFLQQILWPRYALSTSSFIMWGKWGFCWQTPFTTPFLWWYKAVKDGSSPRDPRNGLNNYNQASSEDRLVPFTLLDACARYCVTYLILTLVDEIKDRIQDALFSFPCKFSETPVRTDIWGLTALLFQVPYSIWTLLAKYSPKQHDQQSYLPFFPWISSFTQAFGYFLPKREKRK